MKIIKARGQSSKSDKRVPLTRHITGIKGFSVKGETDGGCTFSATFEWRDEATAYEISALNLVRGANGSPINGTALRDIKIVEIIQQVLWADAITPSKLTKHGGSALADKAGLSIGITREQIHRRRDAGERFKPNNDVLELAATVYEVALLAGKRPVKLIQDDFGIPPSTASHWVKLARDRGNLEI